MSTPRPRGALHFEPDGWVAYTPAGQRYVVRIHVSSKPDAGRWVADAVQFAAPRVTTRDLRDLPLGLIEIWVTRLFQQGTVAYVQGRPKLGATVQIGDPTAGTLTTIPIPAGADTPAPRAKPDEFYRRFAEVYRQAATVSTRPAVELAEAWDKPLTTVHRWTKEARRRGYLPSGESGRRG